MSHLHASDLYPHVFDELGKLKMVAASIGQFSISLPGNAIRRDTVVSAQYVLTNSFVYSVSSVFKDLISLS